MFKSIRKFITQAWVNHEHNVFYKYVISNNNSSAIVKSMLFSANKNIDLGVIVSRIDDEKNAYKIINYIFDRETFFVEDEFVLNNFRKARFIINQNFPDLVFDIMADIVGNIMEKKKIYTRLGNASSSFLSCQKANYYAKIFEEIFVDYNFLRNKIVQPEYEKMWQKTSTLFYYTLIVFLKDNDPDFELYNFPDEWAEQLDSKYVIDFAGIRKLIAMELSKT